MLPLFVRLLVPECRRQPIRKVRQYCTLSPYIHPSLPPPPSLPLAATPIRPFIRPSFALPLSLLLGSPGKEARQTPGRAILVNPLAPPHLLHPPPVSFSSFFFSLQSHLSRLELDRLLQSTLVVDPSRCACYITLGKPRHFSNGSPSCLHHIFPLCSALSCPLSHNFFSWPDSLLLSTTTTTTLHPIVRVSFAKHRNDCRSLLHSLASSRHSP
jgi:hypothetical protein